MVYFIASRIKDGNYLVVSDGPQCAALSFSELQQAKDLFYPYYHILTKTPKTALLYKRTLVKLVITHPVIIGLDLSPDKALKQLQKSVKAEMNYRSEIPILLNPHLIKEMKPGFIDYYQVHDVLKDIESIPNINADGNLEYSYFSVAKLWKGEKPRTTPLSDREIVEIFKSRGLM